MTAQYQYQYRWPSAQLVSVSIDVDTGRVPLVDTQFMGDAQLGNRHVRRRWRRRFDAAWSLAWDAVVLGRVADAARVMLDVLPLSLALAVIYAARYAVEGLTHSTSTSWGSTRSSSRARNVDSTSDHPVLV